MIRIRPTLVEEREMLAEIAYAAKASWKYSPAQLDVWRDDLTPSAESILNQPTFVAAIGDESVGFYQLTVRASSAELEHLWVDPDHMRRGIGGALLAHAVDYLAARGVDSLMIDADPNAEPFYAARGAVRIGEKPAPISGEPDRVLPRLRLSTRSPV